MSQSGGPQSERIPLLVLSALISGTVFFFEPAKATVLNWTGLEIGPGALLSYLLVPWALAAAALIAIGLLLSITFGARVTATWLALYVGFWAQGNVLVWAYGPFDGTPIDWTMHDPKGVLELILWLALFALALFQAEMLRRRWGAIAAVVLVLQAASLGGHMVEEFPFESRSTPDSPKTEHGFNLYSTDQNVLIFVVDALQSDFFSEALASPEFAEQVPPGFVYYRNASSLYASTQFSLQSMLTAAAVPDGVDSSRWTRGGMAKRSVSADLADRGFESVLVSFSRYTLSWFCWRIRPQRCLPGKQLVIDEPTTLREQSSRSEVNDVFNVGLFRLVPHFLKPRVYARGEWNLPQLLPTRPAIDVDPRIPASTRLDLEILDHITRNLIIDDVPPRFRFLHLFGPHPPVGVNRDCDWQERDQTKVNGPRHRAVEATKCLLKRLFAYLRAFESAGIYDETLVFIVSDHGYPNLPIDHSTATPALSPKPSPATEAPSLTSWSRGVPIFLAKNFNAHGPLEISDAPVSLCDIPLSIYDALGIEEPLPRKLGAMLGCHSIFAPETNRPPRMHYRYRAYRAQQRLPKSKRARITFRPYVVDGHSWDPESWHGLPVGSRSDSSERGTHRRNPDGTWIFEPHAETSP